jgi:glyoxylase I family protein
MGLTGVNHVSLTVTDLQRSRGWYERVLDWSSVFEGEGDGVRFVVGLLPGGLMIGLREYDAGVPGLFDPTRVGLDHLALAVDVADLPSWEKRFAELGVIYDPVQDTPFGFVLNFKDPDGIALELTAAKT